MPLLALEAEQSLGGFVLDQASAYNTDVTGGVMPGHGHWIPEEDHEGLADRLVEFLGSAE